MNFIRDTSPVDIETESFSYRGVSMAIRGDLLSVDLSNVFQMLALNRKRGVLEITNRENVLEKRRLYLDEDRISLFEAPPEGELDGYLLDLGVLDYDTFTDNRLQARRFNLYPTEFLYKKGGIDFQEFDRARSHLQEEQVLEIFLWRNVAFTLDEESAPPEHAEPLIRFYIDQIVMEAARRQDEWQRILELLGSNGHDVFAPTRADAPDELNSLDAVTRVVFDYLDGVRATPQIVAATVLPRYAVDLAVSRLVEGGFARKQNLDSLIVTGDRLFAEGQVADAVRLFKCAVRCERRSVAIHRRLANAYLSEGRLSKAAAHMKFCAITLADRGQIEESLHLWREIVRILPSDFRAIELCLESRTTLERPIQSDDHEIIELGIRLFSLWYDLKDYERAERVIRLVLNLVPEDNSLCLSLARVYGKLGKIQEAVECYMLVAARLAEIEEFEGAVNAYKAVISYDLPNKNICHQRIQEIHDLLDRRRRRKVAGIVIFLILTFLVASGVGYYFYHWSANRKLDEITKSGAGAQNEAGILGYINELAEFKQSYPLTSAAHRAEEQRYAAAQRARSFAETRVRELATREEERAGIADQARRDYASAIEAQSKGDLREALRLATCSFDAATSINLARLIKGEGLEAFKESLTRHVEREDRALKRYETSMSAEDFKAAHAAARELILAGDEKSLDLREIRLTSAATRERLKIPFQLEVVPSAARLQIDGGEPVQGPHLIFLDASRPQVRVEAHLDGYASVSLDLKWTDSRFLQLLTPSPQPLIVHEVGEPLAHVKCVGRHLVMVSTNGRVRTTADVSLNGWTWDPPALLNVSAIAICGDRQIVLASVDGRLFSLDIEGRRLLWQRKLDVHFLRSNNGILAVASGPLEPTVRRLDLETGEDLWVVPLSRELKGLQVGGGRLGTLDSAGQFSLYDSADGSQVAVPMNPSEGSWVDFINNRWMVFGGTGAWSLEDETFNTFTAPGFIWPGRPFVEDDEHLNDLVVDNAGKLYQVSAESRQLTDLPSSPTADLLPEGRGFHPGPSGYVIQEVSADRYLARHLIDGTVLRGFTAFSAPITALHFLDRLWFAYTGPRGRLEAHQNPER